MQKITGTLLSELFEKANKSPRKRMNHNFHPTLDALYQRMLNCLMPETYCPPHKHENPAKSESFIILKGELIVFQFDDEGNIIDYIILNAEKGNYGVDILPGCWHSILALTPSVVFESKDGPYFPIDDKEFAPWAPREGQVGCQEFNQMLLKKIGLI